MILFFQTQQKPLVVPTFLSAGYQPLPVCHPMSSDKTLTCPLTMDRRLNIFINPMCQSYIWTKLHCYNVPKYYISISTPLLKIFRFEMSPFMTWIDNSITIDFWDHPYYMIQVTWIMWYDLYHMRKSYLKGGTMENGSSINQCSQVQEL